MIMNTKSNQMMNLYEIMEKWVSTSDNNDNNEYQEQVIDNGIPELMNVTKKSTKEFSKNYQKVLKELTTVNEIIMNNNNENKEINKGVSELIKGYMITDETNRTTRSEEHTSELQSHSDLVCRLLLEKKNIIHKTKKKKNNKIPYTTLFRSNVTKKSTKEFSKNYQKVLKELTTVNEIIMNNNNENKEINKGVSELIKGYMITDETNRTT